MCGTWWSTRRCGGGRKLAVDRIAGLGRSHRLARGAWAQPPASVQHEHRRGGVARLLDTGETSGAHAAVGLRTTALAAPAAQFRHRQLRLPCHRQPRHARVSARYVRHRRGQRRRWPVSGRSPRNASSVAPARRRLLAVGSAGQAGSGCQRRLGLAPTDRRSATATAGRLTPGRGDRVGVADRAARGSSAWAASTAPSIRRCAAA